MPNLIIGTRGSKLALWQTNWIKSRLEKIHPGLSVEVEIIKTTGDKQSEASLLQIGGKGVFTKEIEEALLERRVDLAVHSLKDLPTTLPPGLHIAAITEREDVRDALIVNEALRGKIGSVQDLPPHARVGTSSLRRRSQLLHRRPDLQIFELRGNVDTRLRKLDEGEYDAIILASAGLIRLGFGDRITVPLDINEMLTAVGQGALGIETVIDDQRTNLMLDSLNHWPTRHATEAERALLRELGGGCAVPIAAFGRIRKGKSDGKKTGRLILDALVSDADGQNIIRQQIDGLINQAEDIGARLAQSLIDAGACDLLPRIGAESKVIFKNPIPSEHGEPHEPIKIEEIETETVRVQDSLPAIEAESIAPDATNANKPLSNCSVIVTRSLKQSGELNKLLQKLGADVISCPTIEIREPASWKQLDWALIHLSWYDWLAFTSANGVEYFLRRLDDLGHGRAELMSHRVCAVGKKTAEKLKSEKISVDLMPEKFTAESLIEEFIKRFGVRQRLRGSRILLPASRTTRDVIRPAMDKIGVYVEVVETYQTVLPAASNADVMRLIRDANAEYIIFTSPSTVANLATLLEVDHLKPFLHKTRIACIGPVTAEAARLHGLEVHLQPEEHTGEAIVKAIVEERARK